MAVCDKFLRVSLLVLSWNFSPKLLTIRLRVLMSSLKTNAFRPPSTWTDLFQDATIIPFFMQLHFRIRHNDELAANSMACLAQLASVVGDVLSGESERPIVMGGGLGVGGMADGGGGGGKDEYRQVHDMYVQKFSATLVEMFSG